MIRSIEKVLVNADGIVIGALVNIEGKKEILSRQDLAKQKRSDGNFDNAIITYDGYIKSKRHERLQREVYEGKL